MWKLKSNHVQPVQCLTQCNFWVQPNIWPSICDRGHPVDGCHTQQDYAHQVSSSSTQWRFLLQTWQADQRDDWIAERQGVVGFREFRTREQRWWWKLDRLPIVQWATKLIHRSSNFACESNYSPENKGKPVGICDNKARYHVICCTKH